VKKYIRKPALVEAVQFDMPGEYKILHGDWVSYNIGDWLVKANGKSWIVEGDVFDLLYEQVDIDEPQNSVVA
jgi:hypothetical protein